MSYRYDNKYGNKNDNQFGQRIELDHENGLMGVVQLFALVKSKPLSYFIFFFFFFFPEEISIPDKRNLTGQVAGKRHLLLK